MLACCVFLGTASAQKFKTKLDSATYANGYMMGEYFHQNNIELNAEMYYKGMVDGYKGSKMKINKEEKDALMQYFNQHVQQQMQENMQKQADKNKIAGAKFMEENAKNKDIKQTESGIQYKIIKEGNSTLHPSATDKVKVHYTGTLLDGTVFDSSVQRGEPISFPLNQVIPGWTEGVQLMVPGSVYKFWIPSNLAYGDRNIGSIPPGSTLVFEIELIEINPE